MHVWDRYGIPVLSAIALHLVLGKAIAQSTPQGDVLLLADLLPAAEIEFIDIELPEPEPEPEPEVEPAPGWATGDDEPGVAFSRPQARGSWEEFLPQ